MLRTRTPLARRRVQRLRDLHPGLLLTGVQLLAFGFGSQATRQVTLSISVVDGATRQKTSVPRSGSRPARKIRGRQTYERRA